MAEPSDPSLLQEYRSEFAGRFHPLRLWNDRRRILADPAIAAQPQPALANSPVRFALSLQLLPILFIGWLVGALTGLVEPDDERAGVYAGKLAPAIALLEERIGPVPDAQLKDMARQAGVQHMHPQAESLWMELVRGMVFRNAAGDLTQVGDVTASWLHRLDTSDIADEHRAVLAAKALRFVRGLQANEKLHDKVIRSVTEGGVLIQVMGVFSLLFCAWLLGQMLRGDARFPLAARADRFYLYYSTSHIFWFLLVKLLCFGVGSFAYAAGNAGLFTSMQTAQLLVGLGIAAWLLSRSGEMARVLCGAEPAPKGAAFAIGWRIVAAMTTSMIAIVVIALVVGFVAGIALSMLRG